MSTPSRYRDETITAIICTTCDEEVIRLDDDVTRSRADQAVYDHERARHAIPIPGETPREAP